MIFSIKILAYFLISICIIMLPIQPSMATDIPENSIALFDQIPSENDQVKFVVKRFRFIGNAVISDKELERVTSQFTGREVSYPDLLEARKAVKDLYDERGYTTSSAFVPIKANANLSITNGVWAIKVVEGKVDEINVSGSDRLQKLVQTQLEAATSPVYNQDKLLTALRQLQKEPQIRVISAVVSPGIHKGDAWISVKVTEQKPARSVRMVAQNPPVPMEVTCPGRVNPDVSQLILSGSGGLPPRPGDFLVGQQLWSPSSSNAEGKPVRLTTPVEETDDGEAQGVIVSSKGKVSATLDPPVVTPYGPHGLTGFSC